MGSDALSVHALKSIRRSQMTTAQRRDHHSVCLLVSRLGSAMKEVFCGCNVSARAEIQIYCSPEIFEHAAQIRHQRFTSKRASPGAANWPEHRLFEFRYVVLTSRRKMVVGVLYQSSLVNCNGVILRQLLVSVQPPRFQP